MEYMTRKQASEYLKIGTSKFDELVRLGMPFIMVSKRRRFVAADIDEWLKQGGGDLSDSATGSGAGDGER